MNREYFSVELSSGIDLAIPLANMKVVAQFEVAHICVIPGVADFWYGVTNFKGSLVWVLDSDRFLMQSLMGETPKTAQHRFFNKNTNKSDRLYSKITSVILHQQQAQKKLALVSDRLKGIISIQPDNLKPIEEDGSVLSKCCNALVQTETLSTYIIEPALLLQQLQKRSLLNTKSRLEKKQEVNSVISL